MTSEAAAPAKINLTLHVTGQRPDGYHLLDSLVVFADVGDRLFFDKASSLSLRVTGPFAEGVPQDARNLVWRAAEMAQARVAITLEKNLPHGAGIGGGSSDAAAVLRHFGQPEGAALLGADVPVCLMARAQRMRGAGEAVSAIDGFPTLHAVLANPGVHIATPQVFAGLRDKINAPMPDSLPAFEDAGAMTCWLATQRNDLEAPALALAPAIAACRDALARQEGVRLARMSGSGSTFFGLCESGDAARAAADALRRDYPDWWVVPTRLS